jgi:hypothetical protein
MCSVQCAVCSVRCGVQCAACSVRCAVCTVWCGVQCAVCCVRCGVLCVGSARLQGGVRETLLQHNNLVSVKASFCDSFKEAHTTHINFLCIKTIVYS